MRATRCRVRLLLVAVTSVLLASTACGSSDTTFPTEQTATPSAGPSTAEPSSVPSNARSSAEATLAGTPSPSATTKLPTVSLGTVTDTTSVTKSGAGSANLTLRRKGKPFGIVVRVDCSQCTGSYELTAAERMTPYGRTTAPVEAAYLVNIDEKQADTQSLRLTATGRWTVTVLSWNDLPVVTGRRSGQGSDVIFLGDKAGKLKVQAKPAGKGDSFSARVFTVSDQPLVFGSDEALTQTYEVDLPGVIAITTNGSWTITPRS